MLEQLQEINEILRKNYTTGSFSDFCKNPTFSNAEEEEKYNNFVKNDVKHKLFQENIKLIYKFSHTYTKYNKDQFDDLVQECYVCFDEKIHYWDKNRSPFPSYLGVVLNRHLKRYVEKNKLEEEPLTGSLMDEIFYFDKESIEENEEFISKLLKKVKLTPFQKEILYGFMHSYSGWQSDLAKKHNFAPQWVSECLCRTLKKLKKVAHD